jgi:hypothetical protein
MKTINDLTVKQKFVYDLLIRSGGFVSPGNVGGAISVKFNTGSGHSSTGSPICKRLVKYGLAERNKDGHYKAIIQK